MSYGVSEMPPLESDYVNAGLVQPGENVGGLLRANQVICELQHGIRNAPRDIDILKGALSIALKEGIWKDRLDTKRSQRIRYDAAQLVKFIMDPFPEGLDTTVDVLRRVLGDCPERIMLDEALDRGQGNLNAAARPRAEDGTFLGTDHNHDNIMVMAPAEPVPPVPRAEQGTSASYNVRRLKRLAEKEREEVGPEAPPTKAEDLLQKVRAGEIKPHAAVKLAGIVQPTIQLSRDPVKGRQQILEVYGMEYLQALLQEEPHD